MPRMFFFLPSAVRIVVIDSITGDLRRPHDRLRRGTRRLQPRALPRSSTPRVQRSPWPCLNGQSR